MNGECNNLRNKRWGAQVYPLQRLLPRQNEKFQVPLHDEEQNVEDSIPVRKARIGEIAYLNNKLITILFCSTLHNHVGFDNLSKL